MQKYFYALAAMLLSTLGFAQGLEIVGGDSVVYGNAFTSTDIVAHIEIRNGGSGAADVKVTRRFDRNNSLLDSNAICWVVCFDTETDTSITTITLQAGERNDQDFSGHVYPDTDGMTQSGTIRYVFYDQNNPADSAVHKVLYELTPNFSTSDAQLNDWKVYPNPAVDFLWVDAHGKGGSNARIEFTDVLGRKVLSQDFDASFGASRIAIDRLKSGVYIYGLYDGNQLIEKKKLIVRRR